MHQRLREIADAAGLEVGTSQVGLHRTNHGALIPGGAIHEAGGARMGRSPEHSVVDDVARCWESDNVYVPDGACFPYLPFQNPTLTMMAITDRACEHLIHRSRP